MATPEERLLQVLRNLQTRERAGFAVDEETELGEVNVTFERIVRITEEGTIRDTGTRFVSCPCGLAMRHDDVGGVCTVCRSVICMQCRDVRCAICESRMCVRHRETARGHYVCSDHGLFELLRLRRHDPPPALPAPERRTRGQAG